MYRQAQPKAFKGLLDRQPSDASLSGLLRIGRSASG
jgi:hypothetical protein